MAGVALDGFDVAAVEFEFVCDAGVTEAVKDDFGEVVFFDQVGEFAADAVAADRHSRGCGEDEVVVLVFRAENVFDLLLLFFVLDEHLGDGLGKVDFADAAFCLGEFQDTDGFAGLAFRRELDNDVLSFKLVDDIEGDSLELFVDEHVGGSVSNRFWRDIYAVPGESDHFPDPEGGSEGEVHRQAEELVVAQICCFHQGLSSPDLSFGGFVSRYGGVRTGIPVHHLPFLCLIEAAAEKLVDVADRTQRDTLVFFLLDIMPGTAGVFRSCW